MIDLEGHSRSSYIARCDRSIYTPLRLLVGVFSFRDINTFTVYVTGCDLDKSFSLDTTRDKPSALSDPPCISILQQMRAIFTKVMELERF